VVQKRSFLLQQSVSVTQTNDTSLKYCVIGAGAAGLAVLKTFQSLGIPCECLEQNDNVGGIWYYGTQHSSVYQSTHLISSKGYAAFRGFPMPEHYPAYPSHTQVWEYLKDFARQFDLYGLIQFSKTVERVEPRVDDCEIKIVGAASARRYRGVIIANGHLWSPVVPEFPGSFNGNLLHARDYKSFEQIAGRRVLVVGCGNSGCDIAVESSRHAQATFVSLRRGHYFVPKFLFGKPIDAGSDLLYRLQAPHWLHRLFSFIPLRIALGKPEEWGLPIPDHRFLDEPPVPNTELINAVGHGRIQVRPSIKELCGNTVRFSDGREEQIDIIVLATGYRIHFPFLDSRFWSNGEQVPQLFLNMFHPVYDNLMFAGLFDASVKTWELVERQAELMATFIKARDEDPAKVLWFREMKSKADAVRGEGAAATREFLYREYFSYRRQMQRLRSKFKNA
jgi:cation diffusion facilitator CzcD-associated flavoprotein CzcO